MTNLSRRTSRLRVNAAGIGIHAGSGLTPSFRNCQCATCLSFTHSWTDCAGAFLCRNARPSTQSSSSPSCPLTDQAMVASRPSVQHPVGSGWDQPAIRGVSLILVPTRLSSSPTRGSRSSAGITR